MSDIIDLTRDPWHRRLVHRLRSIFARRFRAMSAVEYDLRSEVARLHSAIEDRDHQNEGLRYDKERLESQLKIAGLEIEKLTGVVERDRKRVEAETAIHVHNAEVALGRGPVASAFERVSQM